MAMVALVAAASIGVLASTPRTATASTSRAAVTHSSNWAGYYSLSDTFIDVAYVEFAVPKVTAPTAGVTPPLALATPDFHESVVFDNGKARVHASDSFSTFYARN